MMSLQPTTHGRGLPSHITLFEEAFTEFEPDAVIVGVINRNDVMQDANREHIRVGLQRSPEAIDDLDELRLFIGATALRGVGQDQVGIAVCGYSWMADALFREMNRHCRKLGGNPKPHRMFVTFGAECREASRRHMVRTGANNESVPFCCDPQLAVAMSYT